LGDWCLTPKLAKHQSINQSDFQISNYFVTQSRINIFEHRRRLQYRVNRLDKISLGLTRERRGVDCCIYMVRYQRMINIRKSKKKRQYNGQKKKNKRTNNDMQNTTRKTKDRATQTH
jgi:hypothetical protein